MKSNLLFIASILIIISIAIISNYNSKYEWLNWILYIGYGVAAVYTAPDWAINIVIRLIKVILAIIVILVILMLSLFAVPCLLLIALCSLLEKKKMQEGPVISPW